MWYSLLIFAYGISWIIVYLSFIRNGWKEKIYCMPFFCIANEVVWDVMYSSTSFKLAMSIQTFFFCMYGICALVFLYQFIRYGKKTFPSMLQSYKKLYVIVSIISAIAIQLSFFKMWRFPYNMVYTAYIHTYVISFMLLLMLWIRGSKGYDLRIAFFKTFGDCSGIILSSNLYTGRNIDLAIIYIGIALIAVDILFLLCLIQQRKKIRQVEK